MGVRPPREHGGIISGLTMLFFGTIVASCRTKPRRSRTCPACPHGESTPPCSRSSSTKGLSTSSFGVVVWCTHGGHPFGVAVIPRRAPGPAPKRVIEAALLGIPKQKCDFTQQQVFAIQVADGEVLAHCIEDLLEAGLFIVKSRLKTPAADCQSLRDGAEAGALPASQTPGNGLAYVAGPHPCSRHPRYALLCELLECTEQRRVGHRSQRGGLRLRGTLHGAVVVALHRCGHHVVHHHLRCRAVVVHRGDDGRRADARRVGVASRQSTVGRDPRALDLYVHRDLGAREPGDRKSCFREPAKGHAPVPRGVHEKLYRRG
jgi:hypothetical protein